MILSDIKKLIVEKLESENRKCLNENIRVRKNIIKSVSSAKQLLESENLTKSDYQFDSLIFEREEEFLNDQVLEEIASSDRVRRLAGTDKED